MTDKDGKFAVGACAEEAAAAVGAEKTRGEEGCREE